MPDRGDRDDVDILAAGIQPPGDLDPVRVREVHIEQDDIDRSPAGIEFVEALDGLVPAQAGCRHVETGHPGDEVRVRLRRQRIVFDDEHPQPVVIAHQRLLPRWAA